MPTIALAGGKGFVTTGGVGRWGAVGSNRYNRPRLERNARFTFAL
jgi:hypothetical protein